MQCFIKCLLLASIFLFLMLIKKQLVEQIKTPDFSTAIQKLKCQFINLQFCEEKNASFGLKLEIGKYLILNDSVCY